MCFSLDAATARFYDLFAVGARYGLACGIGLVDGRSSELTVIAPPAFP